MLRTHPTANRFKNNAGFTFVELCIVMVIVGVMVAAAMQGLTIYYQKSVFDKTKANIASVETELRKYVASKDAYPCPAIFTSAQETAGYGQPDCPGTISANGTAGKVVRIGSVPTRALGLPDSVGVDGWGQKLTYAITEDLTQAPIEGKTGAISVVDKADTELTAAVGNPGEGHYVVFSNGPDAKGAFTTAGVLVEECPDDTIDSENCDNDDAIFRYSEERSLAGNEFNYDDVVAFRSTLASSDSAGCDVAAGQVVVDFTNGEPQCGALPPLTVNNCPVNQYLAGIDEGNPQCRSLPDCGAGRYLEGVDPATGAADCRPVPVVPPPLTISCLGGQYLSGINAGARVCANLPAVPVIPPIPSIPNCASGQVLTKISGNISCVDAPSGGGQCDPGYRWHNSRCEVIPGGVADPGRRQ